MHVIRSTVSIAVPVDHVEAVQLQGTADVNADGNGGANSLQGNAGANTRLDGDQGFRLVEAFSRYDAAHPELTGQMTLTLTGGITIPRLDVNGDARADYQMKINGDVTGESGDWLL